MPMLLDGQRFSIGADIEHREVERIRAVEIHGLRVGAGRRVAVAHEIVQTGIADETEGLHAGSLLGGGDAVRILLRHGERVVGDQIRPRRAERTGDDGERIRNFHIGGLVFRVGRWASRSAR